MLQRSGATHGMRTGQRRLREASRALQSSRPRRPIAIATALDDHRGVRRGFLPRGLCNTCPDATRTRDYLRAWAGVAQALTGVPARGPRKLPVAGHPRRGRLASPARSPTYGRFRGTAAGRLHRRRMTGSGGSCRSTAKPERQHPVLTGYTHWKRQANASCQTSSREVSSAAGAIQPAVHSSCRTRAAWRPAVSCLATGFGTARQVQAIVLGSARTRPPRCPSTRTAARQWPGFRAACARHGPALPGRSSACPDARARNGPPSARWPPGSSGRGGKTAGRARSPARPLATGTPGRRSRSRGPVRSGRPAADRVGRGASRPRCGRSAGPGIPAHRRP